MRTEKALTEWMNLFTSVIQYCVIFNTLACMLIFYSQKGEDEALFVESEISPLVSYAGEVRVDLTIYCSDYGVKLSSQGLKHVTVV